MPDLEDFLQRLRAAHAVLVTVARAEGSTPREPGAWMAVFEDTVVGSIGGGHLEWQAIAHARQCLAAGAADAAPRRYALGPSLGQCCGGVVHLGFELAGAGDGAALRQRLAHAGTPVALFGGGHVGHAIVRLAAELPFSLHWIDSRDEVFPDTVPTQVQTEHSDPVQAAVADLVPHSRVLIMSFSHAEDLDIVAACLLRLRARDDLPHVGLIGSKTKWATFRHRLQERGFGDAELARITSPIGIAGIPGKEPEVIAVAVAAQLLQMRDADTPHDPHTGV